MEMLLKPVFCARFFPLTLYLKRVYASNIEGGNLMKKILAMALTVCMLLSMVSIAVAESTPAKTKLTLWTFISQHDKYYYSMVPPRFFRS